jgi:hypothetical protein
MKKTGALAVTIGRGQRIKNSFSKNGAESSHVLSLSSDLQPGPDLADSPL